ncbi:MAG: barstar family protein [Catenulispora sp.]|nr:barstar family protein [Catenulispora sp.]
MTALAHVLGEVGPGVHVWHSERPASAIRAEAEEIAWRCVVLDGSVVVDKTSFLNECDRAYNFPVYFGRNWDALADCLADLQWLPPPGCGSGGGILTVFEASDVFARADPDAYAVALEVFEQSAQAWAGVKVPFTVLLRPAA